MPAAQDLEAWRVFRILAEFVDGFETMNDIGPSVSIFGSARKSPDHPYYHLGVKVAKKIAEKGFAVITGGGPGLMEAANKGAQEGKGRSCGIGVELPYEEGLNPYIDRKYRIACRYFFIRKVMFVRYAQAFVFLPGGYGTLDELFEALNLIQTKRIKRFPIFLMGASYWQGLAEWLKTEAQEREGHLTADELELFTITDDADFVVDAIFEHFKTSGVQPTFELKQD